MIDPTTTLVGFLEGTEVDQEDIRTTALVVIALSLHDLVVLSQMAQAQPVPPPKKRGRS